MEGFTYRAVADIKLRDGNVPGPKRYRKFTNLICLLIFVGTIGFSVYTFIVGYSNSKFHKLVRPYDSDGNPCGVKDIEDLTNFKYLYFNTKDKVKANLSLLAVCVNKCPTSESDSIIKFPTKELPDGSVFWAKKTEVLWGRFCIPTEQKELFENVIGQFYMLTLGTLFEGVRGETTLFIIFAGISLVAAYIYSRLLRWWARFSVYTTFLTLPGFLITLIIIFSEQYRYLIRLSGKAPEEASSTIKNTASLYLFLFVALISLIVLLFVMGILLCDRIRLSIRVIQAASDFITDIRRIQIVPVILYILMVGYFTLWWTMVINLYSDGTCVYAKGYAWGDMVLQTKVE